MQNSNNHLHWERFHAEFLGRKTFRIQMVEAIPFRFQMFGRITIEI